MLDRDALPLPSASLFRRCHPAEAFLEFLLGVDLHAASAPDGAIGAERAEFACRALYVVELHGSTKVVALGLTGRARDQLLQKVEAKISLRETTFVGRRPGLADEVDTFVLELGEQLTRHVAAIEVVLADTKALAFDRLVERRESDALSRIGRQQLGREDDTGRRLCRDVALVAVEG